MVLADETTVQTEKDQSAEGEALSIIKSLTTLQIERLDIAIKTLLDFIMLYTDNLGYNLGEETSSTDKNSLPDREYTKSKE